MIERYLGFDSDYVIIGLVVLVIILLIVTITNSVRMKNLKKNYKIFMSGNSAKNLEDTLIKRLEQVDFLLDANAANEKNVKILSKKMNQTYQKMGLIKYDALNEMGQIKFFSCNA